MSDPIEQIQSQLKAASGEQFAFYKEHFTGLVEAYNKHKDKYDREALCQSMVKSLMESDNTREDLCYQVVTAVRMMSSAVGGNFR